MRCPPPLHVIQWLSRTVLKMPTMVMVDQTRALLESSMLTLQPALKACKAEVCPFRRQFESHYCLLLLIACHHHSWYCNLLAMQMEL